MLSDETSLVPRLVAMGSCRVGVSCKADALSFRGGEGEVEEPLLAVAGRRVRLSGRGFLDEGKLWRGFVLYSLSLVPVGDRPDRIFFLESAS